MNEEEQRIWQYLVKNALGIENAIRMVDLASEFDYDPYGSNNDNFRPKITNMIKQHGKQIGTCDQGVFVITNQYELDGAIAFVTRGTKAEALRRNGIYNI
ncbi:MAG: hypothetical protein R6V37_09395 [Psychroflexus maritimus]